MFCYRLLLVTLAVALFPISSDSTPADSRSNRESEMLCGPNCLRAVCSKMGVAAGLDELKTLCGYDDKSGTTMLGLHRAAEAKGLHAVSMKISLSDLLQFKGSVIAHTWRSHFVLLEPEDADKIRVSSPPGDPQVVVCGEFQRSYSGFALLIAKDAAALPQPEAEGPDLRFDRYGWDFGSLDSGLSTQYSFRCRNVGNADLTISKVQSSCEDCVIPLDWTRTIPPGGEGEVKVVVRTEGQKRGIAKQVYVTSNDPISATVRLDVTGYVKPDRLLVSPETLNLGTLRRTESTSREIRIPVFEEDGFKVLSASSDSPFVDAGLAPSTIKDLPGYAITAALKPGAPVGDFKAKITIVSDHPKQPKAEVPVTAVIKGNIDLDRDMFFLGLAKQGKGAVSNVTISTVSRDPLKIGKIDNPLDCVTVEVKPKTDGKEYVLTATLKPDAPLGNIKGEVTVHTNAPDQLEIKIPVYAYVER